MNLEQQYSVTTFSCSQLKEFLLDLSELKLKQNVTSKMHPICLSTQQRLKKVASDFATLVNKSWYSEGPFNAVNICVAF